MVLEDTFDTIRLFEGKVTQDSEEALHGMRWREGGGAMFWSLGKLCKYERSMYFPHVVLLRRWTDPYLNT